MLDAEKIGFFETSFKRLYWSGYQGRFGALSWPTGWFNKPAHVYGIAGQLVYAAANAPNYDRSESVARRVGRDLAGHLTSTFSGATNRHVIAHSMGNVIVSEALRHHAIGSPSRLVDTYIASEAAEVGGAYNPYLARMSHFLFEGGLSDCEPDQAESYSPEGAWRCYNLDEGTEFDMPPDLYRQTLPMELHENVSRLIHGSTGDNKTEDAIAQSAPDTSYYGSIQNAAGNIVNAFNVDDAALNAWEFNQLTKPDNLGAGDWEYSNEAIEMQREYNACLSTESGQSFPDFTQCDPLIPVFPEQVHSQFIEDPFIGFDRELQWSQTLTEDSANILALIVPGRTSPLGHGEVPGIDSIPLEGFTDSNQDHSGQFHGYYGELRKGVPFRAAFWNQVLGRLIRESRFSGLQNNLGVQQ